MKTVTREQAANMADKTCSEVTPITFTLTGEEQMSLCMDILRGVTRNEEAVKLVLMSIGQLCEAVGVEEAVDKILKTAELAKPELISWPRILKPMLIHLITKTMEIEKRNEPHERSEQA